MIDLKSLYTDFSNSSAYGGINKFYKFVKSKDPRITRKDVVAFLEKTDSYTLHKPRRKVKDFRRIFVKGIGYQYNADLVDMQKYSRENNGYKWILNIIGTLARHVI